MTKQEYMKIYMKEYQSRPEVIKRRHEYMKEYRQRPKVRERMRQSRCVTKEQNKVAMAMWLADGFELLGRDENKQPIFKTD